MRECSVKENEWIKFLSKQSVSFELIHITETGLSKGILDATNKVRHFLSSNNLHDFESQKFGAENKVFLPIKCLGKNSGIQSKMTLYRSSTRGDRRLWVAALNKMAMGDDLVALTVYKGKFLAINISRVSLNNHTSKEQQTAHQSDSIINGGKTMSDEINELYPLGFVNWSGSKKGGVRHPFKENSGRPAGEKIETPLTIKLENWVDGIVNGGVENPPRAILLIGGPGNGKTDAVEGCIEAFDNAINANGALTNRFAEQYTTQEGKLPPRKSIVVFSDLWKSNRGVQAEIHLVQDATEKDTERSSISPEQLFNDELSSLLSEEFSGIYICCINRGILANAYSLAHKEDNKVLIGLISELVKAASGGPKAPDCWPLEGKNIAIWPMDVESLVFPTPEKSETVMHQILKQALKDELWQPPCENSLMCPFCQNKLLLSEKDAQNNLVKLLLYYELCAGKRWTFRDLYSLVSYLLLGDQEELMVGKKIYSPCDWTAKQLEIIKKEGEELSFAKAPYLLMSKLYYHRLFSLWPKLNKGEHRKAKLQVLKKPRSMKLYKEYVSASSHFRALGSLAINDSSSIRKILSEGFSQHLDPALLSGDVIFFEGSVNNEKTNVTACVIDERFGLSVSDGLKLVSRRLPEVEKRILKGLTFADEFLMEHNHSPLISNQVRFLQASIRQFSSRLVKRSLGVRYGRCKNVDALIDYSEIHQDRRQIKNTEKQIRGLINEHGHFSIPLSTTFGQPVSHRDRDISLLVNEIKPRMLKQEVKVSKPMEHLPYIAIHKNRWLPVTFNLFKSLREVENGLNEASLPEEVFAMLDEVKSIVAGEIVRDGAFLDVSADIKIGSKVYEIDTDEELAFIGEK